MGEERLNALSLVCIHRDILPITCILLQFHLQISLIVRINPFSDCSHCLEASQVVCDANRLTGLSVMGISFEGSSQQSVR